MYYSLKIDCKKDQIVRLHDWLYETVAKSGVTDGMLVLTVDSPTAGLGHTPKGLNDYDWQDTQVELKKMFPSRINYSYQATTPQNVSARSKSAFMGSSLSIMVSGGEPVIGHSESVFFYEFDGPKTQTVQMTILGR